MDCSPLGSSVRGIFPEKNYGVGCHALQGNLPDLGIEPASPVLWADSSLPRGSLSFFPAGRKLSHRRQQAEIGGQAVSPSWDLRLEAGLVEGPGICVKTEGSRRSCPGPVPVEEAGGV